MFNNQYVLDYIGGFWWADDFDLNTSYEVMGWYGFSNKLCTIILPWSEYHYYTLPIGVCVATDAFQEEISFIFEYTEMVMLYMDDFVVIGSESFEENLATIDIVTNRFNNEVMQFYS